MIHSILNLIFVLSFIFLFFFLIKKFLKRISYLKSKILLTNIVSILFSILLYFLVSLFFFNYLTKNNEKEFNEVKWKNNITERHKMIDDLLKSDYFIGKSKSEIQNIFGLPKRNDSIKNIMEYELIDRTWADFKIINLKLFLKNETVVKFEYSDK